MTRTLGAMDRYQRKTRNDKGKRRKRYKGKIIKKRSRRLKYLTAKGRKEKIKLWVWEKRKMSREGIMNWCKQLRPYIKKTVYHFGIRIDAHISNLETKEDIENLFVDIVGYEGEFLLMGFSRTQRNLYHVKPVKICRVVIVNTPDGLKARMTQDYRLWRYKWFYKGSRRRDKNGM